MHRYGFSLLELMIVIAILAGVSAFAFPSIRRLSSKTDQQLLEQKRFEAEADARYKSTLTGHVLLLVFDEAGESSVYTLDNLPEPDIISGGIWIIPTR